MRPIVALGKLLLTLGTAEGAAVSPSIRNKATPRASVNVVLSELTITNVDDVRGNLYLPEAIGGYSVSWQSGNADVISSSGVVNRQASNVSVDLTAWIDDGGASYSRVITANVRAAATQGALEGYMFAYFTGNTLAGENIYFAASNGNNALSWAELNGGQPILTSTLGTKGLRDPFIMRSPQGDTFYLLSTDLSIGSGTSWGDSVRFGSRYLEVWESHDLITWSAQRHVLVSPPTAGNTWAPEAFYDDDLGSYIVFWASELYAETDTNHTGSTYHRVLRSETRDFVTFSDPVIWEDSGVSRIDSTVIKAGDTYYRFTKDEGGSATGCVDIIQERATNLTADVSGWTLVASCIGANAGTSSVEGPTSFKSNVGDANGDKYYLFVDEYSSRGYIPLETADIANPSWKVSSSFSLPTSPRHGTVLPVTAAELAALKATYGSAKAKAANSNGEILRYDFSNVSSSIVPDASGNGQDGTIYGNTTVTNGAVKLNGVDSYIQLPNNLLAGVTDVSVEIEVLIDASQSTPYFIFGIGNTVSNNGAGYLFSTGDPYRFSIATGNWQTEQTASSGSNLARGVWLHLVYSLKNSTATIYLNGTARASNTGVTIRPSDIGTGYTTANYIGRSDYTSDHLLVGQVRKFVLYNRALAASEVAALAGNPAVLLNVTLADSSVLKAPAVVDDDTLTVVFPCTPGTDLTSLAPIFTTGDGITASPSSGTTADLSKNATYTLSVQGGASTTWTLWAAEMRSPVLPGYYADPNIAVYGNTYYIYATSDGVAGWGGNTFYVWSSPDLVEWTRSEQPFLTLNGTAGNVPWATGNAWAPTITERNGTYYFYFSGQNPTYNRKTIGAAVATDPKGPWTAQPTAMITNGESVSSGQAIDPCAFFDPVSGKYYLFWGNGSPLFAELGDDMVSVKSGTIAAISGLTDFREGSFVVYRKGLYHMTYSIDDTGSENYRIGYATSTSVSGPWTYRGVILQKDPAQGILATGHNSIISVPGTDHWYIAYHRFHIPGGDGTHRETTIDVLNFDPNTGFILPVVPTLTSVDPEPVPASI
ncbi:family 43 glycosyl hydrolase [Thozetella sp. PMI_491]|nr:family 43 glycosyl hydrolase [Thozetella sp. PMI_491]